MNDLTLLEKEKLIKRTRVTADKLSSTKNHFYKNIKAAQLSEGVNEYLFYYDALFRLLDYALLKNSYELTNLTPHLTFKKGLKLMFTDIIDEHKLTDIINERHNAKKKNILPKEKCLGDLKKIINNIQLTLKID